MNGRILGAAAALAVLAGPVWGQAAKPPAVVNGQPISMAEVDAILRRVPQSPTPLTEAQKQVMRREAVEFLVNDAVMKQFFKKQFGGLGAPASHAPQVNKEIDELLAVLKKKGQSFPQFLSDCGQTEAQLRTEIAQRLQWRAYLAALCPDAEVKKYYDRYKPFFDKVLVRASHILTKLPEDAKDLDRLTARNKLLALRREILTGKIDFAAAAKQYSDCTTKTVGGDIGFFPLKGAVLESFADAAFALKVGEVSGVVVTENGLHLIKVTERTPGEPSDFEKIKEDVRRICMAERENAIMAHELKIARIEFNVP